MTRKTGYGFCTAQQRLCANSIIGSVIILHKCFLRFRGKPTFEIRWFSVEKGYFLACKVKIRYSVQFQSLLFVQFTDKARVVFKRHAPFFALFHASVRNTRNADSCIV